MPWRVPPVGGSYRGSASQRTLFGQKPSFLLSCPGAGPAAEAARASVYN